MDVCRGRLSGQSGPVHLHKVLGDSQSWVVLSGKERGPRARTFFWAGPLGRSGGFGLSGSLLVISRATLVWQGSGDTHTSPPAIEAAGGLAWVEILCRPSRALKLSASQSPETEMWLETWLRIQGVDVVLSQAAGLSTSHGLSREGPAPGHGGPGSREVRHRCRSAGPRVSARCTACTWRCSPHPPGL